MKKITKFLPILLILTFQISCQKIEVINTENSPHTRPLTLQETKTIHGANNFAFNSFNKINSLNGDKNILISPFSIGMAVCMAYNGADGTTKDGIKKALDMEGLSNLEIDSSFKSLSTLLMNMDKTVSFTSANSMYYNNKYTLQNDFINLNKNFFNAEVKGLDFADVASVKVINDWVNNKTNGKITDIINKLDPKYILILLNAIYFKGTWTYKFEETLQENFNLLDGSIKQTGFLSSKSSKYLLYSDTSKTLVDLPYGNKQFSMTLIMPNGNNTLENLIGELNYKNLNYWIGQADTSGLQLKIPKFKMSFSYNNKEFNKVLSGMGMAEAFSDYADFSKMVVDQKKGDLKIDEVIHKTFIDVNETGTEAAAVTAVLVVGTTAFLPHPLQIINFNKPYIYLIREKNTGAILFIGKMMNPTL